MENEKLNYLGYDVHIATDAGNGITISAQNATSIHCNGEWVTSMTDDVIAKVAGYIAKAKATKHATDPSLATEHNALAESVDALCNPLQNLLLGTRNFSVPRTIG